MARNRINRSPRTFADGRSLSTSDAERRHIELPHVYLTPDVALAHMLAEGWDALTVMLLFADGWPPAFNCGPVRIYVVEETTCL